MGEKLGLWHLEILCIPKYCAFLMSGEECTKLHVYNDTQIDWFGVWMWRKSACGVRVACVFVNSNCLNIIHGGISTGTCTSTSRNWYWYE